MPQDDVLIDVDIPGLAPTLDTAVHTGIDAPKPGVNGSGIAKEGDDISAAIAEIKRERDAALARAAAAETAKTSAAAELESERSARVAAEKQVGTSNEGKLRAEWNAANTQHEQFAQGVLQMRDLMQSNENALAAILGDENLTPAERGKRAAAIQTKISLAASDLRTLEVGEEGAKRDIERLKHTIKTSRAAAVEAPKTEKPRETQQAPLQTSDQWISQFPAKTQDWLKTHRDYVDNQNLNKKLIAFAEDYHDGGAKALHDDDFIAALDKRFGFAKERQVEPQVIEIETAAPKIQRPTATAAPVSRNSGPAQPTNTSTGRVRLTPDEQNTAIAMFPDMDVNEAMKRYGRNKAEAIRDGKYNS